MMKSRNVQHILQPFLAARHGFLLNEDGSPDKTSEEAPKEDVDREDELDGTEDDLLVTKGLLETADDESVFETEDGCLVEEEDGLLETEDGSFLEEEEGDGLLTRDDVLIEEEEREEDEDCTDENAGFLDNVGAAGLERGPVTVDEDFGEV
jgi:hypothetical protein